MHDENRNPKGMTLKLEAQDLVGILFISLLGLHICLAWIRTGTIKGFVQIRNAVCMICLLVLELKGNTLII